MRNFDCDRNSQCALLVYESLSCQFFLEIHDLLDLHQKPAVDFREVENLLGGKAAVLVASALLMQARGHIAHHRLVLRAVAQENIELEFICHTRRAELALSVPEFRCCANKKPPGRLRAAV